MPVGTPSATDRGDVTVLSAAGRMFVRCTGSIAEDRGYLVIGRDRFGSGMDSPACVESSYRGLIDELAVGETFVCAEFYDRRIVVENSLPAPGVRLHEEGVDTTSRCRLCHRVQIVGGQAGSVQFVEPVDHLRSFRAQSSLNDWPCKLVQLLG
jgi:hypothetical protein